MTIEEKAKAYDNTVNKLRRFMAQGVEPLITRADVQDFFPELAENEDERIRKELHIYLDWLDGRKDYAPRGEFAIRDMIAWLEKQSEKPQGKTALEAIKEEKSPVESLGISSKKYEEIINECIYSEAIPKFKNGDWITNSIETVQITGYDIDYGYQVDYKGNLQHRDTDIIEKEYHLWTIKEAKDGDVLVNGSNIFIFSYLSDTRAMGYCHINLDDGRFYDDKGKNECFGLIDAVFSPATKEQRDLLFAKMHEAGYEWDGGKGLRKIEQKLSNSAKIGMDEESKWTEEDEQYLLVCKNALHKYQWSDKWDADIISKWLEDKLKQRMEE